MSGTRSRALHTTGVKQRPPTKQMIMSGMPHTTSGTKTELGRIIVEQAMQAMSILVFVLRKDGFALYKKIAIQFLPHLRPTLKENKISDPKNPP